MWIFKLRQQQPAEEAREQDTTIDPALQGRCEPRAPSSRPSFGEERRADSPFSADAECSQKAEAEQLPPRLREVGKAGEERIGQNRQHQCPASPQEIADPPKERTTHGPTDEKRGLDERGLRRDLPI